MNNKETIEDILRHERDLIDKLLRRIENSEDKNIVSDFREIFWHRLYPFYDNYLIEKLDEISEKLNNRSFQCPYSEKTGGTQQFMIAPEEVQSNMKNIRNTGLQEIRDFTSNCQELIIIDPYIFGGEAKNASTYIEEFKRCSRIDNKKLTNVHIIYSSKHGNTRAIKNGIKKLASDNNCTLTSYHSDKIHDRIWIKDKSEAIVVGTSFGGIGNRLCFILKLPKDDLTNLLKYIQSDYFLTSNDIDTKDK